MPDPHTSSLQNWENSQYIFNTLQSPEDNDLVKLYRTGEMILMNVREGERVQVPGKMFKISFTQECPFIVGIICMFKTMC